MSFSKLASLKGIDFRDEAFLDERVGVGDRISTFCCGLGALLWWVMSSKNVFCRGCRILGIRTF